MKNHPHLNSSLWYDKEKSRIFYIDQNYLPWNLTTRELVTVDQAINAIRKMEVRGAPLIGVTAAFGMYLAAREKMNLEAAAELLKNTRPTAVNLNRAVDKMLERAKDPDKASPSDLLGTALGIYHAEINRCHDIGVHGLPLIEEMSQKKDGQTLNILTHCNAGWLASVQWGTALAPVYMAHDKRIKIHVWVDETRPRNQGAKLTAWELKQWGVPCTVIPDNTGGHLMQNGMVDMVIVGTDRTAANGDVANKIGTYLKALAAKDNSIPFYVAMPWSTYDPNTPTGKEVPIEERDASEVITMEGYPASGSRQQISLNIIPPDTPVANYGFDITPAFLVTAYITEIGVFPELG